MIISGPQSGTSTQGGSQEQIVGQFRVARNSWQTDFDGGLIGLNLKGLVAGLAIHQADVDLIDGQLGQCCVIGLDPGDDFRSIPLGVIVSDLVLDGTPLTGGWVSLLMYGHCNRILSSSDTSVASGDQLLFTPIEAGTVNGMTLAQYGATRKLTGVVSLFVSGGAETVAFNLDGTPIGVPPAPPSSEWTVPPGLAASPVSGKADYFSEMAFIGYHYVGDVPIPVEESPAVIGTATVFHKVKGFVRCLGMHTA